jgi:hypothetical protein
MQSCFSALFERCFSSSAAAPLSLSLPEPGRRLGNAAAERQHEANAIKGALHYGSRNQTND